MPFCLQGRETRKVRMSGITVEEATRTEGFEFEFEPSRPFASVSSEKEVAECLGKWGLGDMVGQHYRCDTFFRRGTANEFLLSLLNHNSFQTNMRVSDGRGGLRPWTPHASVQSIDFVPVRATLTSLNVFDKLKEQGIVRDTGSIARCMDIYLPSSVTLANLLRAHFMAPEDELPDELQYMDDDVKFTEDEKSEFLYHVMHRIVAGGSLCQWEDDFEPYKDACRALYKDMVVVSKRQINPDDVEAGASSALEVQTLVYQIRGATLTDGTDANFFPKEDAHSNFFYVAIHPQRRALTVWYHGFWSVF
jgi:hypothetical protein